MLSGGWLVSLLYGPKYTNAATFIAWLAAMWGLRIFRVAPTVAAIAQGDTQNAMFSNLARSLALIGMLCVAAVGAGLFWIPICGFVGEMLATAVTIWRLSHRNQLAPSLCLRAGVPFFVGLAMATAAILLGATHNGIPLAILATLVIPGISITAMFVSHPHLLQELRAFLGSARRKLIPAPPVVESVEI
jgi:O-antigen/teichoic acid export membrane protein